jgi:dihydrolipoamide dehydrogenase
MDKYDIVVIGGGPGGYIAAIRAAQLGARVCLIEKDKLGGTCLNRGCIPTKSIIACTALYDKLQKAENFGLTAENLKIDFSKVIARKDTVSAKLSKGIEFLLEKNGVVVIKDEGKYEGPGQVSTRNAGGVTGEKIILATGSAPTTLPGMPFDGIKFISSDDALNMASPPAKIDIVGGGVIGIHFAAIYSALGIEVTVYEALPEILPGIDEEIVAAIKRILKRRKVEIKTGVRFNASNSCGKTLICVGRTPAAKGIQVNEKMETPTPGVYAVGDLVSKKMLAHVAYEQGVVAAENALGGNRTFSYDAIPIGIYTNPEVGSVGLTEKEAREKFSDIKVGKFPFAALGIAQAMGETEGFIKVVSRADGKIVGIHILGTEATTLIGTAALTLKNQLTVDQLAETFQAHPSYPEGLQEAALAALKRSLHIIN